MLNKLSPVILKPRKYVVIMLVRNHRFCINLTMQLSEIADPCLDLSGLEFVLHHFI